MRTHYVIRGGEQGWERLQVLARVMQPFTATLLDRVGVTKGMSCLDVGCGGGQVTCELARRVGPEGKVLGLDIDETKLSLARRAAARQGLGNAEFQHTDIRAAAGSQDRDLLYSRFLLTHLSDPARVVGQMCTYLRPGGVLVLEDIDFSGYFTHPPSPSFRRYHALYTAAVRRRGGDPDMGPRLPMLLAAAGFESIQMSIVQPMGFEGEVKLLNAITMENIADVVVEERLASREEIDYIVRQLYEIADIPCTIAGMPRVVQAWGYRGWREE
jgi:ubiquinone/menaquinone biosynthesis C-methylase UbiE